MYESFYRSCQILVMTQIDLSSYTYLVSGSRTNLGYRLMSLGALYQMPRLPYDEIWIC